MLMIKQIKPLLKNKFFEKKHNWRSQMLMYVMTLQYFFSIFECLEKIIYEEWLGVPTIFSSFSDDKLGIVWMTGHRNS